MEKEARVIHNKPFLPATNALHIGEQYMVRLAFLSPALFSTLK